MSSTTITLLIVIGFYYIFCLGVGASVFRKKFSTAEDYFVAGRSLGPIVLSLTILATVQSAWMMLGHQGNSMLFGIPYWTYYAHILIMGMVALLIFSPQWLIGKKFGFITPAEMFGEYYESELTRILMVILGILYIIPYLALQLVGGGTVFQALTRGEIPYLQGAIIVSIIIVIYIFLGGIRAAAITNAVQGALLVLGIFVLAGLILVNTPGGFSGILEGIKELPQEFRLIPGVNNVWRWQYILTLAIAPIGIYTSPVYSVIAFTARSPRIFRWQIFVIWGFISGFYYYILSPIIGTGGRMIFGLVQPSDALTPTILVELAPVWLMLLVSVAIFAAMNSTADGYMAVAGQIISRDIYRRYINPNAPETTQIWFGRFMVIIVVAAGLFFAIKTSDIIVFIGSLATAFGLQTLPALIGMIYWRRLTPAGINVGLIAGMVVVMLTYGVWKYPLGIHCSVWGLIFNFGLAYIVSQFTRPVSKETQEKFATVLEKGRKEYLKKKETGTLEKVAWF